LKGSLKGLLKALLKALLKGSLTVEHRYVSIAARKRAVIVRSISNQYGQLPK
jgi:hypothetical protein